MTARRRARRRVATWLAATGLLTIVASGGAASAGPPDVAVEATYLYKFAPFVTWPNSNGANSNGPNSNGPNGTASGSFNICVVGDDPFGDQLDRAIAGQTLDGRPIQVMRVETIGPKSDCAIAYLGGSRSESVAEALKAVRGTPTLTVTDEGDPPGIIAFAIADGHVRFRVDEVQAQENGLVISSKLLGLAIAVRAAPGQEEP